MNELVQLRRFLRIEQWYKNFIIFIPLIFSVNFLNFDLVLRNILGFVILCLVSSAGYIINDINDRQKDRAHPEKKNRPIASGVVPINLAITVAVILLALSLIAAYLTSISFLICIVSLFLLSQLYTFYFRNVEFMDMIVISINFVLRAAAGIFIINTPMSYWIILCTFFISMFLVSGKRISEIALPGAKDYRSWLNENSKNIFLAIQSISMACVLIFFSIYSIYSDKTHLLISLPFALFIFLSYMNEINHNPVLVRNPEKFIFSRRILVAILLWLVITSIILYSY